MKLITKQIEKELAKYPLYSQDGKKENAVVICKFFAPVGAWTWYVLEAENQGDDYMFFGIVINNHFEREYGYFSLSELSSVRLPYGLTIERDIYFEKCKVSELN